MAQRIPVLLDTDIGNDIDDAVALAYLLKQPRCELVGITTVTGAVNERSALADAVCRAAGRTDVPVHSGAGPVLLHGPGQPTVHQYGVLKGRPHRSDWPPNTAIEFMRKTIRKRPGEITLLSIGPLTNVALLFATDPEVPGMLKDFVSMAGVFYDNPNPREWNCLVDPVATAMAFAHPFPRQVLIGLDVTMQCRMPMEEVRRRFTKPPLDFVATMAEVWFKGERKEITYHDPLAAAVVFKPELCGFEEGEVEVDPGPGPNEGRTKFTAKPGGRHRPARKVDPAAFFEEYFSVFGA